jgi:hypothetical protein
MSLSMRASPNGQTFRLNAKSDDPVFYLLVVAAVSHRQNAVDRGDTVAPEVSAIPPPT